jgi:N-acetylneuraminic acid mutarotase
MTGSWTPRQPPNIARGGLASATVEGRIYAIGGYTTDFAEQLDSVEVLRPGTGTWELVAPMLTRRSNPGAAAVGNRIYVFGGFDTPDTGTDRVEGVPAELLGHGVRCG